MADSEVRQKFEAWKETLINRSDVPTLLQAFSAGMRAGEIARWIPVEEKLPEVGKKVLVLTTPGRHMYTMALHESRQWRGYYMRDSPQHNLFAELTGVTHWQPLPAAPQQITDVERALRPAQGDKP